MSAASQPIHAPVQKPEIVVPSPKPAKPSPGRPIKKWLILFVVLAVVAGAMYWRKTARETATHSAAFASIRTGKVTSGPFERWTRIGGQTAAIDFVNVTAPSLRGPEGGREMILMELAKSGSFVKKGTLVAQIDAQTLQDHIDDLGDTIETAQADIAKRKAEQSIEWENLQHSIRVAKSEADKARLDYSAAEVRTDIERQILKLNLDEAEARYKQLQADVKQKQLAHAADVKLLGITLERHTRHRDRHKNDLKMFSIYAPIEGLVVMSQTFRSGEMVQVSIGDSVRPGQSFMKIVDTQKMRVDATINQTESSEIRLGQHTRIHLDAFPGLQFAGHIEGIAALAAGSQRQGYYVRNVPVRVRIEGHDPRLIPDLSASVEIIQDKVDKGVIAPLGAIQHEDGKPVAYVKKADGFERRELQLGLQNTTHTIVLAGLEPGEEIRLN
jgi:multidrug efflux pump subunit AcrA (membrane-fusion protein)